MLISKVRSAKLFSLFQKQGRGISQKGSVRAGKACFSLSTCARRWTTRQASQRLKFKALVTFPTYSPLVLSVVTFDERYAAGPLMS